MVSVSVIIPCYNPNILLLEKCLQSILHQSYRDFEVLVIDDGSKEECKEELRRICSNDKVRLIHKVNGGVSSARNLGVESAKGEYICCIDDDDTVTDHFLERAVKLAEENNADMVIGGVERTADTEINLKRDITSPVDIEVYANPADLKIHLISLDGLIKTGEKGYITRGPIARLVKTEIAKNVPFDTKLHFGEDQIWNLQLLKRVNKIVICKEVWYYYYINTDSVTKRFNRTLIDRIFQLLEEVIPYLNQHNTAEITEYCKLFFEKVNQVWNGYINNDASKLSKDEYKSVCEFIWNSKASHFIRKTDLKKINGLKLQLKVMMYKTKAYFMIKDFKKKIPR